MAKQSNKPYRKPYMMVLCEAWNGLCFTVGKIYRVENDRIIDNTGSRGGYYQPDYCGGRFRIISFNDYLKQLES